MTRALAYPVGLTLAFASFIAVAGGDVDTSAINAGPIMSQLDLNGDGYVDRQEAQKMKSLAAVFDEEDKSKDDKLDSNELARLLARIGAPPLPGTH